MLLAFGGAVNFTEPSGSTRPLPEEAELFFILCSGSTTLNFSDDITVSLTMPVAQGFGPRDEGLFVADRVGPFCVGCVFSGVSPTALIPLVTILQMGTMTIGTTDSHYMINILNQWITELIAKVFLLSHFQIHNTQIYIIN